MGEIQYKKTIEEAGSFDIIVAGAGPAGIAAAVTSARKGAKVALIERFGVIGGNLSVGHVGPILGEVGRGTITEEIMALLDVSENDWAGWTAKAHDFELGKVKLANLVNHENITVYLQTAVIDVIKEENRVRGVIISGKEGLKALYSKVVIDCTGDGDVAVLSGCEYEKGRDEDGLMQPCTLEFTIDHVDEDKAVICVGDIDDVKINGERFLDFCSKKADEGVIPKHLAAVRLHPTVHKGQRQVNTTQANRIDSTNVSDIYKAEVELRNQIPILMDFFRKYLPGYENCQLISSGDALGVRESRRIMGEYKLTVDDEAAGRRFDDVVVHKALFFVDIHNPDGAGQAEEEIQTPKPYDIPYRCMVPLKVDGLLVAGRCISGTHKAHASYRVMSICMAMGQAAGTAATICAKEDVLPRALDAKKIQADLTKQGVDLFYE